MYIQIFRYFQGLGSAKYNGSMLKTGVEVWEKEKLTKKAISNKPNILNPIIIFSKTHIFNLQYSISWGHNWDSAEDVCMYLNGKKNKQ